MKKLVGAKIKQLVDVSSRRKNTAAFKKFSDKYHLVYFGHVDQHDDEHELVRGITLSARHLDRHYSVGSIEGRDITILERTDTLHFPGKTDVKYTWRIMAIDLPHRLPHVFLDLTHYDEIFYANTFLKQPQLKNVSTLLTLPAYDSLAASRAKLFLDPNQQTEVMALLSPVIVNTIFTHFKQFDYELEDDTLLIYDRAKLASVGSFENMLRIGLWLEEQLSGSQPPTQTS